MGTFHPRTSAPSHHTVSLALDTDSIHSIHFIPHVSSSPWETPSRIWLYSLQGPAAAWDGAVLLSLLAGVPSWRSTDATLNVFKSRRIDAWKRGSARRTSS